MQKINLKADEIIGRLNSLSGIPKNAKNIAGATSNGAGLDFDIGNTDIIIAVGRGGIIPAAIVAKRFEKDMGIIWIRQYTDEMPPKKLYAAPRLVKPFNIDVSGKRVLVVDDISRSGNTLNVAKSIILKAGAKEVKTLAFVGLGADFCLFETDACAIFPWSNI